MAFSVNIFRSRSLVANVADYNIAAAGGFDMPERKVIEVDHFLAAIHQLLDRMRSDVAQSPCNQYSHPHTPR